MKMYKILHIPTGMYVFRIFIHSENEYFILTDTAGYFIPFFDTYNEILDSLIIKEKLYETYTADDCTLRNKKLRVTKAELLKISCNIDREEYLKAKCLDYYYPF